VENGNLIQRARVLTRESLDEREGAAMKLLPPSSRNERSDVSTTRRVRPGSSRSSASFRCWRNSPTFNQQ